MREAKKERNEMSMFGRREEAGRVNLQPCPSLPKLHENKSKQEDNKGGNVGNGSWFAADTDVNGLNPNVLSVSVRALSLSFYLFSPISYHGPIIAR